MAVFGKRTFKEVMMVEWSHKPKKEVIKVQPYNNRTGVLLGREEAPGVYEKAQTKGLIMTASHERLASGEASTAHTLTLDLQPLQLWEHQLLLFQPPTPRYFVMAAWPSNILPPMWKKILYIPNAPPISAPLVGMLTFTMPQSDPFGLCVEREAWVRAAQRKLRNTTNKQIQTKPLRLSMLRNGFSTMMVSFSFL